MKNSKFLLIVFTLSLCITTTSKSIQIKKEYLSLCLGLAALIPGVYKDQKTDYITDSNEDLAYKNGVWPSVLMSGGIMAFVNTLYLNTKFSKQEIMSCIGYLALMSIGVFKKLNANDNNKKNDYNLGVSNGHLMGAGVGLIGSTLIKYLMSVIEIK